MIEANLFLEEYEKITDDDLQPEQIEYIVKIIRKYDTKKITILKSNLVYLYTYMLKYKYFPHIQNTTCVQIKRHNNILRILNRTFYGYILYKDIQEKCFYLALKELNEQLEVLGLDKIECEFTKEYNIGLNIDEVVNNFLDYYSNGDNSKFDY